MVLTLNFKVVGNQVNRAAGHNCMCGLCRRISEAAWVAPRRVAASSVWLDGVWIFPRVASLRAHARLLHLVLAWSVERLLMLHVLGVRGWVLRVLLADTAHVLGRLGLRTRVLRCVGVGLVVAVYRVLILVGLHVMCWQKGKLCLGKWYP